MRWYDPSVGRWISEDPEGFAAGGKKVRRQTDLKVDTGEAFPELPGGGIGDCIGSILDFL
jgi:hypothetical protein